MSMNDHLYEKIARLEAECAALKADLIALDAWYWSRPVADVSARVLCIHEAMQAGDKPSKTADTLSCVRVDDAN